MLEAINYIRNVSKKKVTIDRIVTYLNNAGASKWDKESAEANLKEMQTKGIINENYKPLITLSSDSPGFSIMQDDVCITPQVDCDVISATMNPVIPTPISDATIATPNIGSLVTPCTLQSFHSNSVISSSFSSQLDSLEAKLCDKIMAMKSFFMDELQTIQNETLKSAKIRNTSNNIDHGTVNSLQTKIKLLENENKLLKDDIKNKQKLIDSILEHNSNLTQAQNIFAHNHSVTRKINDKSIRHTNTSNVLRNDKKNESNVPKDDRFKEVQVSFKDLHPEAHQPNVKKNIVVIGDSIIKNVNGRDVSRGDSVKIRPHPGASTEDLFNHIKPVTRKIPDIVVIHTGTNDLQNNCNIVKKAKKLVSAVKEVDKDNSIKIAFSSIINREDEDFKDKIMDVNNKLKNYCNSAGMDFIDNSNIDSSCLNRGKLHLNRKGTAALAKHFAGF